MENKTRETPESSSQIRIRVEDIPKEVALRLGKAAYEATLKSVLSGENLSESSENKKNPAPFGAGPLASAPEDAPEHPTNEDK